MRPPRQPTKVEKVRMRMQTTEKKWAVVNRESGSVASTRESGYNRKALFATRREARKALREGRVYVDPSKGKVARA